MNYLTIQDILWINLQVTKKVQHFNYARLEEATFYQYAYGESNTLFPQAARFVSGFVKMHPFDAGNDATAFVACLAFLKINGYLAAPNADLAHWFNESMSGKSAIDQVAVPDPDAHHGLSPDVHGAVNEIVAAHSAVVDSLVEPSVGTPDEAAS